MCGAALRHCPCKVTYLGSGRLFPAGVFRRYDRCGRCCAVAFGNKCIGLAQRRCLCTGSFLSTFSDMAGNYRTGETLLIPDDWNETKLPDGNVSIKCEPLAFKLRMQSTDRPYIYS